MRASRQIVRDVRALGPVYTTKTARQSTKRTGISKAGSGVKWVGFVLSSFRLLRVG